MATCRLFAFAAGLLLVLGGVAQAYVVTLDAVDRGWYSADTGNSGYHEQGTQNYLVGQLTDLYTTEYRNFFVFDLTDYIGTIASATLRVNSYEVLGNNYNFELHNVATNISDLVLSQSNQSTIFADLADGATYGNATISQQYTVVDIPLSSGFLDVANGITGDDHRIALGGILANITSSDNQLVFSGSDGPLSDTQLILQIVPEPGTFVLALLAAASVLALNRRRRLLG
jgi:hypothetical protein